MMRGIVAAVALTASPALADGPVVPRFVEETASSGLESVYEGEWEYMVGGGVAAFDCSGDGLPELFTAGGASKAALFLNRSETGGALRFESIEAGVETEGATGAYPLDVDGDGITDLAILRVGENLLMRGLGDCRFERANEAWGFDGGDAWHTAFSATWEKGAEWPTLAVGTYIDRTQEDFPWGNCTTNWLIRPEPGERRFAAGEAMEPGFCALSMLFTDWNRSGAQALRVTNDREYYKGGQEQLWQVLPGAPAQLFTEADGWARLRVWGMGIASADLDGDTYPEYFLTSMADSKLQTLKVGPGKPTYADVAFKRGVTAHRPYTGGDLRPSTGWHAQFEDVNNDCRADLFVAKGNVWEMPDFAAEDPNNLLLQREDGTFEEAGDRAGVASLLTGRGGAVVDLNADGALDLVVVNRFAPAQVWRNTGEGLGHWVALKPVMPGANRDAIGAWIEVRAGEMVTRRELTVGGGHVSGQLVPWHFGLAGHEEAEVRVIWPDGTEGPWQKVAADGVWVLSPGAEPVAWVP
jgi:hypothetical protein